ncbi:MAG TPA: glycosyltransferase [Nitrosopumilaceae archaeon]|nr:glycosyltransferase [Nitrosopumilaceae archaeon]
MKSKKILHIWDTAGVGSILAKYQRKLGHQVKVVTAKHLDPLNITRFYGNELWEMNKKFFGMKLLLESRKFDIVHVHSGLRIGKQVKRIFNKPILIHYHGSDVRLFPLEERRKHEKFYDKILVATPDLINFKYIKKPTYLPNPIDTDLFTKIEIPSNNKGVISLKKGQTIESIKKSLEEHGIQIDLEILEQTQRKSFLEFKKFRQNYEYYLDLPFVNNEEIKAHSLTGLQSMAMGQKVIDFDFIIKEELPEQHKPENVVKELNKIYEELLQ